MDYANFNDCKLLKVIPGKLSRYVNAEPEGDSNNVGKSTNSSLTYISRIIPAKLKVHLNQVKFTSSCSTYIVSKIKDDVFIKLKWSLFGFTEQITSPDKLDNSKAQFDYTTKYDMEVDDDFMNRLNETPMSFFLYAVNAEGEEIFLSQQQYFLESIIDAVNVKKDVNIHFSSNLIESTIEDIGYLDIWYKFSCKQKSLKSLFSKVGKLSSRKLKSIVRLNELMDGKVLHDTHSLGAIQITDSEMDHFTDGLLLVLNRNKVLKTSQQDISKELEERVRWLRFEANWKQTLQENAILHGKDPTEVLWRQWREEDTANVRLRTYHHKTKVDYIPELSITVVKLIFFEGSAPIKNSQIVKVYVEYSFLNIEGPEMETPFSLSKPQPNEPIYFNFKRTFKIDAEGHYDRCKMLADLIKRDEKIKFIVVSEPFESLESPIQACQEIGYAEVLLSEVIQLEENADEFEYEIVDVKNSIMVVGYLTIKIEGILALRKMALNIMAPKGYKLYV